MLRTFKLALAGFLFAALTPLVAAAANTPSTSELQDRAAIQNLVVKYTIALDTLDADMYASVFAEDAEFTFGGNTYRGRDAIRKIVTEGKFTFPIVKNGTGADNAAQRYAAYAYPTLYLVGPDGKIRGKYVSIQDRRLPSALNALTPP